MKKQSVKLVQSESHLPSINIKSNSKTVFTKSPTSDLNQFKRNSDKGFPEVSPSNPRSSLNLNLNKKVSNLLKIIEEQDMKIKSIESELNLKISSLPCNYIKNKNSELMESPLESNSFIEYETNQEYFLPIEDEKSIKKSNLDFSASEKMKDLEILKLKKQIQEEDNQILKLQSEYLLSSQKLNNLDFISVNSEKTAETIQTLKIESKEKIVIIEQEIENTEKKIQEKLNEIQELAEILKKSEEKRTYSNEYNIFMENNEQKLKEKLKTLQKEKEKIAKEILEIRTKIVQQEKVIQETVQNLQKIEEEVETEKQNSEKLNFKYETAKEALQESLKQHELQAVQFRTDLESLEKKDCFYSELTENCSQKLSNINDSLFLINISKEETLKLQQKFNRVEKELIYSREALERLKKNEIYLKNQFSAKELMISQIEKMLKNKENTQETKKKEEEKKNEGRKGIKELQLIVKTMKENYSRLDLVKCIKCQKLASTAEFLLPCGHLVCSSCFDQEDSSCSSCGAAVSGSFKSKIINKAVSHLKSYQDRLSKANKLLMHN